MLKVESRVLFLDSIAERGSERLCDCCSSDPQPFASIAIPPCFERADYANG